MFTKKKMLFLNFILAIKEQYRAYVYWLSTARNTTKPAALTGCSMTSGTITIKLRHLVSCYYMQ